MIIAWHDSGVDVWYVRKDKNVEFRMSKPGTPEKGQVVVDGVTVVTAVDKKILQELRLLYSDWLRRNCLGYFDVNGAMEDARHIHEAKERAAEKARKVADTMEDAAEPPVKATSTAKGKSTGGKAPQRNRK